ncbi:hypothetical protein Golomagni_07136 [Golovinomyces magnicellulatus]|nr:hypothetical protein Golomagni_07136 [Golovinomyces magnicellulatus]
MLNGASYAAAVVLAAQSATALSPSNFYDAIVNKAYMKTTADYPSSVKVYNLSVPVDHFHDDPQYEPHSDAKFPVRYFLEASYYKPGGPVIVIASGETSAEDRVPYLNNGIGSHLAKATGGMVVSLEHRYYGTTFPVPKLSLENYRFLTTEQAVADAAYFAKNVQFPGFEDHNLTAPNTPWIIYGGSYAGAFAAFTRKLHPDAYWGAISSSGVTEAIYDYWEYNEAARLFAPGDCGPIMGKMTHVVDTALLSGNNSKVQTVKQLFGFSTSVSNPDFGDSISHPADALQGESWAAGYCPDAATRFLNYVGLQRRESNERMKNGKCASASKADCVAAHIQKRGAQLNDASSWPYQTCTQ